MKLKGYLSASKTIYNFWWLYFMLKMMSNTKNLRTLYYKNTINVVKTFTQKLNQTGIF